MNKKILLNIKILHLDMIISCYFSLDLTLQENIELLNVLLNEYINNNYVINYNPIVVVKKTGLILNKNLPLFKLNLLDGMLLLFY